MGGKVIEVTKLNHHSVCVGPQIGMNPKPILGLPDLEYWQIPTQTNLGIPVSK